VINICGPLTTMALFGLSEQGWASTPTLQAHKIESHIY